MRENDCSFASPYTIRTTQPNDAYHRQLLLISPTSYMLDRVTSMYVGLLHCVVFSERAQCSAFKGDGVRRGVATKRTTNDRLEWDWRLTFDHTM
jgi:hypothetical protein